MHRNRFRWEIIIRQGAETDDNTLQECIFKSVWMSALSCMTKLGPNEKSLSGVFRVLEEIWIHKSYTKCVCVRRIVGKSHEEGAEASWIKTECFCFFCIEAMRTVLQAD